MNFTLKSRLIEQIVGREMSIYNLQLGHRPELSVHQHRMLMQRGVFNRRRLAWTKSIPELKRHVELMHINNTLLSVQAAG